VSDKDILQQAVSVFKRSYPGLTAEAIICFIVASDLEDPTVGQIAQAVGMTEPQAYQHISMLTSSGVGLVTLQNTGDGRNVILLSALGLQLKANIDASISA
jgi:DNA-binding transcriptional ArsR family regulator